MHIVLSRKRSKTSLLESAAFCEGADWAWKIAFALVLGLYAYLIYALFAARQATDAAEAAQTVGAVSFWLNLASMLAISSFTLLYYEEESLGGWFLVTAVGVAFGLPCGIELLLVSQGGSMQGAVAEKVLATIWMTALILGATGLLLLIRQLVLKIQHHLYGQDLLQVSASLGASSKYGASDLLGPFAACWQKPICRAGLRNQCVVYHAKARCWKEGIGCICEPNLITTTQTRSPNPSLTPGGIGFIPLSELITPAQPASRLKPLPARTAKNGIRIPSNPHLSAAQKRERCRNCVIYNDHQGRKYRLLCAPTTLLAFLIVLWQQENLRGLLQSGLLTAGKTLSQLTFNPNSRIGMELSQAVAGSVGIQYVILGCLALILLSLLHQALEYCVFKLKI
jgi:hypothetical protein